MHLIVSAVNFYPLYETITVPDGGTALRGLCGGPLDLALKSSNITYHVVPPNDGEYGVVFANGTMNGMLKMAQEGRAHIAAGPFAYEYEVFKYFHFSPDIVTTYITILSGMDVERVPKVLSFTNALDRDVWIGLLIAAVVLTVQMLIHRKYVLKSRIGADVAIDFVMELYKTMLQEASKLLATYNRIIVFVWLIVSMVIGIAFSGVMRTNLIVQEPTERIDSVKDLTDRPELTIYTMKQTPIELELLSIYGERGDRLREHMMLNSEHRDAPQLYGEAIRQRLVNKTGVIILDGFSTRSAVSTWCKYATGYYFFATEYISYIVGAWAVPRTFPNAVRKVIEIRVRWIISFGIQFLSDRELYKGNFNCVASKSTKTSDAFDVVKTKDLEFTFYTWILGLSISCVIFIAEICAPTIKCCRP